MIGIDVQPRRPCTTSMPSMPGRPRSTIAASCALVTPRESAASPVSTRSTSYPRASMCAPSARSSGRSSSTIKMRLMTHAPLVATRCGCAIGRPITIVTPPPGVSSTVSSPPTASTNPRATARPRPTPVSLAVSPRRWNGSEHRPRSARRDAATAVDDTQIDTIRHHRCFDSMVLAAAADVLLDAERHRFHGGGNGARVEHVLAHVRAVIHAPRRRSPVARA